ncbi:hypothetical protein A2U01_0083852, partial [Trifolium medium]|nr:hypothetical protein [Trifolium medium]
MGFFVVQVEIEVGFLEVEVEIEVEFLEVEVEIDVQVEILVVVEFHFVVVVVDF